MPNYMEYDLEYSCPESMDWKQWELNEMVEFEKFMDKIIENKRNLAEVFIPFPPERAIINKKMDVWEKENPKKDRFDLPYTQRKAMYPNGNDWFNSGGYEWCSSRWGTKWGILELEKGDYEIYTCKTAWSYATPVFLELSKRFPKIQLYIRYYERGMAIHGYYKYENGVLIEHKETEYYGNRGG